MKSKHLQARIDQCLRNAELSTCPRRKFGAMLIDPGTTSIISDGYNGSPRGAKGTLCKGGWCERDGVTSDTVTIGEGWRRQADGCRLSQHHELQVRINGDRVWGFDLSSFPGARERVQEYAEKHRTELLEKYPPVKSGTQMEKGCHHAESNAIANAARRGASTEGAWLVVTGEPCMMCAKLIHHCGVVRVVVVKGGYAGGDDGVNYLKEHDVTVQYVDGPQDPRS